MHLGHCLHICAAQPQNFFSVRNTWWKCLQTHGSVIWKSFSSHYHTLSHTLKIFIAGGPVDDISSYLLK